MSEKRAKGKNIMKKVKEIWDDWKVTSNILRFLFLFIAAVASFGMAIGFPKNWSSDIDAPMINSLVSIFVTVPITLLTGAE
ncbi:hypothetical protein [Thermoactinomyces sp. CICC 10523]|uniref:hypothetical protein n=1 Tax=Thermoactinomyces sp. CICC 10523 TaxID=2767428 RepID=UPI0018DE77A6|nr:hypothetical protein [Thermoactinomyces sp. CICC 10523]MBH8597012.1 hypothetical protein [Thermoactinomyces sp. CICC 10523]